MIPENPTFEMKPIHLALLRRMYVQWDDAAYDGAPCIGIKRPYGNSDVVGDVAEEFYGYDNILGWTENGDVIVGEGQPFVVSRDALLAIHREMDTALQIALCTGSFETGTYQKTEWYRELSWKKVS